MHRWLCTGARELYFSSTRKLLFVSNTRISNNRPFLSMEKGRKRKRQSNRNKKYAHTEYKMPTYCSHLVCITCTCFPNMYQHKCYTFTFSIRTNMIEAIVIRTFMRKYCYFSFKQQQQQHPFTNFILQFLFNYKEFTRKLLFEYIFF